MRILFILNPHAGSHTVDDFEAALASSLETLESEHSKALNCPVDPLRIERLMSETPDQLRRELRRRLLEDGVDVVGVVGGDGTVMEALPVMVEFPAVKLALLPYGTGNLLAMNLGIPRDFKTSLDVAITGVPRRIDVGRIGRHYFALLAGVGAVADIMENTSSRHKRLLGMWAYLVEGIRCALAARKAWFKVTLDGQSISTTGISVVVSNAASLMRPCPALTPEAMPDDGLLDVCIIKAQSRRDYLPAVYEILTRQHVASPTTMAPYYQGRKIRIESWPRMKVQADGNIIGKTPVDIEIISNRLKILVPAEAVEKKHPLPARETEDGILELLKSYFVA